MSDIRSEMMHWLHKLSAEGYFKNDQYCLSTRTGQQMVITPEGLNIDQLTPESLVTVDMDSMTSNNEHLPATEAALHASIYHNHSDFNAIIHSYGANTATLAKAGKTVRPVFDDFAQLIGINAKVVSEDHRKVSKALKFRNGVYLKNNGALCASCDLDDAYAVAMVMDKNSKAVIETSILGGGKVINVVESALMRVVYKMKYSKAATDNR